jgi:hypothetical protein
MGVAGAASDSLRPDGTFELLAQHRSFTAQLLQLGRIVARQVAFARVPERFPFCLTHR